MSRWWVIACALCAALGCQKTQSSAPPKPASAALTSASAPRTSGAQQTSSGKDLAPAVEPAQHEHPALAVCRSKGDPLQAARRFYDSAQFDDALSCAAKAAADYPGLPEAHSERGAALSALGRFEEAQVAYARALAIDPDYPDALLGAAHLYAVSLPSSREYDELASTYSERGLASARASRDSTLVAQFALVSAMAFNDLGRADEALGRAEEILKGDRLNKEALYERAVALFELCRFNDAKVAFTALLDDEERGPHAHHHLGLLLERDGDFAGAEKHFAAARARAPQDFPPPQLLSVDEFKREVDRAVAELPEDMKRDLVGIPISAEDLPRDDDLLGGEPPLSPTILGLYRGPPIGERCEPIPGQACRSVALYRRNLARAVTTRQELLEQIRVTLHHEVGHLRGEDDYELAARGLE